MISAERPARQNQRTDRCFFNNYDVIAPEMIYRKAGYVMGEVLAYFTVGGILYAICISVRVRKSGLVINMMCIIEGIARCRKTGETIVAGVPQSGQEVQTFTEHRQRREEGRENIDKAFSGVFQHRV